VTKTKAPTQAEAVAILEEGDAEISMLLAVVEDADFARLGAIGGGEWSAKDLLAHLTFWESNALEALEDWRAGKEWRLHQALQGEGSEDPINDAAIEAARKLDADAVRSKAGDIHSRLLKEIGAMKPKEWGTPAGDGTRGSELGSILVGSDGPFRHAFEHLGDLREYVNSLD
jgi:hypothetical protein